MASHSGELNFADTIDDAVAMLSDTSRSLIPVAGATWLMRAPLRKEGGAENYLSLAHIEAMKEIALTDDAVTLGALVTHQQLADTMRSERQFRGLACAGGKSANPGVRQLATVAGNICTADFAAADIVPALLAQGASLDVVSDKGYDRLPLADYLKTRAARPKGELVILASIARTHSISAHARLTMRAAGDYPIAIVSVCATLDRLDKLTKISIAVGSVEATATHWTTLEQALIGEKLDPDGAETLAKIHLSQLNGRDAVDAKGTYRVRVLPHLVRLALADLARQRERSMA